MMIFTLENSLEAMALQCVLFAVNLLIGFCSFLFYNIDILHIVLASNVLYDHDFLFSHDLKGNPWKTFLFL